MAPPQINPVLFLGLRTDIRNNAQFISDFEIIYPCGGVLVLQDFNEKTQKYIHLSGNKIIKSMAVAPNKQYVALNETKDGKPSISIYDLATLECAKTLTIPFEDVTSPEFVDVQFTCDSEYLVAITGEPEWMLLYYNWKNGKIESQTKAQNPNGQGRVEQVNCNPNDPTLVVVTGPGTFRLLNVSETIWRQWGWAKAENITIATCTWLTQDRVLFGTHIGALMTVENGELKEACCYRGFEVSEVILKKEDKGEVDMIQIKEYFHDLTVRGDEVLRIRCLTVFPKGFAYSCGSGLVHLFEKESRHKWVKRNVFKVSEPPFKIGENEFVDLNVIQNISVNPSQTNLTVTTLKSQLYGVQLFQQHMDQEANVLIEELGPKLHHSKINDLAMCSWKPIFMTSGEGDHSIRLWNYEKKTLEISKFYLDSINSIALHPTGLFALISFSDKLRYIVILIDDFYHMREFSIRNCKLCSFSNNGHLFSAVNGLIIQIFSTISFMNLYNFKGHGEIIKGLSWTARDDKLFSCGLDGAVYEWCMATGNRLNEIVNKKYDFTDCSVSSDGKSVYVVGPDGGVKEIRNDLLIRNLKLNNVSLDNIVLARSDMMLFVTGGNGIVVSVQFPLLDKAVFKEYRMHNKNIKQMRLSYDDKTLITVAEDATMCIWQLDNNENKAIVMDKDFSYSPEILINKQNLEEKNNIILELSKRINEMETEHAYQLRQTNSTYTDTLREVNTKYCRAIADLKDKLEHMEDFHNQEIDALNDSREKMILEYESKIDKLETTFNANRIEEFSRFEVLKDKFRNMQNDYDGKISTLSEAHEHTLEGVKGRYEMSIAEKCGIINKLEEKNKLELNQYEFIKQLIEEDADREIIEIKTNYEKLLKAERDMNIVLKGENDILKRKIQSAQKDIDDHKFEINQLHDDHKQMELCIRELGTNIGELKMDIKKRDAVIENKEKQIHEVRTKKEDLEKRNFILFHQFQTSQLESAPKDVKIGEMTRNINILDQEKSQLIKMIKKIEVEKASAEQRTKSLLAENKKCFLRIYELKLMMSNYQKEFSELSSVIQDPSKLKNGVKKLLKYKVDLQSNTCVYSQHLNNITAIEQHLNDQRDILRQKVMDSDKRAKSASALAEKKCSKIIDQNMVLLERINSLQNEISASHKQCAEMKTLLGFSSKLPIANVRSMVHKACVNFDEIKHEHESQLKVKDVIIASLQLENERLKTDKPSSQ